MSTNDSNVAFWNNATIQLNRYFSVAIFVFGIVGNILNVAVLAQKNLRTNSCAYIFLISSFANLVAIFSGLFTRTTSGWAIDLTNTVTWLCQIRTYLVFVSRTVAYCLLALATIDRWLLSSPNIHRRRMSTIKNAKKGMIIIIIISCLLYAQIFHCYEANLNDAPLRCYGKTLACRLVTDLTYAFAANIIPLLVMLNFGLMTIINLQNTKIRVNAIQTGMTRVSKSIPQRSRRIDHYLLMMLLVQVIFFGILTLPQNIQKLISIAKTSEVRTSIENAIENFIFNFFLLFAYFANGMSFYVYTLFGGNVFRNELRTLFKNFCRCC